VQLALLTFVFWLVPAFAPAKNELFGLTFGFSVAFMTAIALASIYRALPHALGAAVVSVLGFSLLVFYQPTSVGIPNTPQSVLERELAWRAIDRIKADLVGNAVDQHGTKVYMTNIGAYAPNILQYYLLKTDPTLDWTFKSLAYDSNAQQHIDVIRGSTRDHTSTQDFVIAGERYNGLTYQRQAWPAEDTVYAAMWRDPNFMALDRFYGPGGREITIFARRGSFAGWRPVSMAPTSMRGVVPNGLPANVEQALLRWERTDDQRYAAGGLIYLQTFAARPIEADLEIEWVGEVSGQKLTIIVNQQNVAELTYSTEREISSLRQQIRLSRGTNDIVLKSDAPVRLNHLLIVPYIAGKPPEPGISVATATYGRNCKAPQGNATRDVAESCQGKSDCAYKIQPARLGDPAQGCGKNFTVSYFCPSESVMRHNKLPAESDGKTVRLSCAPGISVASATYGGNCGAPQGNATYDVASSCNGTVDCNYTVDTNRLGDPTRGCDKDFAVSYFCPSESAMRHNELSGKSDGQTLSVSCDFETSPPPISSSPPQTVTKVTNISDLPPLPETSSGSNKWDLVEGLSVEVVQGLAVVSGQHILRLVAAGANGRHALAARFHAPAPAESVLSDASLREILTHFVEPGGIYRAVAWVKARFFGNPKSIYRATAWVKAEPGVRLMIEARDSVEPRTGNPSNYGVAKFDLSARSVVDSTGNILASGVEAAADGWVKVWIDLRSRDGQIFALIGLLEGSNNQHVFTPADQSMIFGGFETSPR
jgi:hypothetical protein